MDESSINLLKDRLKSFSIEYTDVNGTPAIYIDKEKVLEVAGILRDDPALSYNQCVDAVSVDRFVKKNRFEMIYNLISLERNQRLFIKIRLDSIKPEMQSLTQVWDSADWYEREAFDMMGIEFINHPDLKRMYMPQSFEYHPLRKDFPLMGIPDSIPLPNK